MCTSRRCLHRAEQSSLDTTHVPTVSCLASENVWDSVCRILQVAIQLLNLLSTSSIVHSLHVLLYAYHVFRCPVVLCSAFEELYDVSKGLPLDQHLCEL